MPPPKSMLPAARSLRTDFCLRVRDESTTFSVLARRSCCRSNGAKQSMTFFCGQISC
jgi:hypothetical protein